MPIDFYNPPSALLASGSKEGMEIGGAKTIISIDDAHNFYNEGVIFTEMSWAAFMKVDGLEDVVDTIEIKESESIGEDPTALADVISKSIYQIITHKRVFYGILDVEVDAFVNQNTLIPGLKLDYTIINKLMEAHRRIRDENLFPQIINDAKGSRKIKMEIQGTNKRNVQLYGSKIEDYIEKLRMASGFTTGIVCTSRGAANFYIMSDNIIFQENEIPKLYIDDENITIIDMGIQRDLLFPISWFRIDLGLKSLETLELWEDIKQNEGFLTAINYYERYMNALVYKKFQNLVSAEEIGTDLEDDFYNMSPQERRRALRDMAEAIKFLTRKYKE